MKYRNRISLPVTIAVSVMPCMPVLAASTTTHPATRHHSAKAASAAQTSVHPATTSKAQPVVTTTRKKKTDVNFTGEAETINVTTDTHATNRKARESSSPVSVISAATLRHSGMMNVADTLTRTYASINVQAMGADSSALTSSIQMRGLGPNEVLMLVDGKRRHNTANITADAGPQFGSTGADLNTIPASAIDHIEVLEDGAAAMYGSDTIAGVVNIITKKQAHGMHTSVQTGANAYNGDGWQ